LKNILAPIAIPSKRICYSVLCYADFLWFLIFFVMWS